MKRLVTCPETGHLEEIEYEVDPVDGHILGAHGCSRHQRNGDVRCGQICVVRLNARLATVMAAERDARLAAGRPARDHAMPIGGARAPAAGEAPVAPGLPAR